MKKILIISDDICAVKQIVNSVNKIEKYNSVSIVIYDIYDFKNYLLSNFDEENTIYFIDIYHVENEFLDLLKKLQIKDSMGKVVVLNTNSCLKSLLQSQPFIYSYIQKGIHFTTDILQVLIELANENDERIHISNSDISAILNKKNLCEVYNWPIGISSFHYKCGNNQVFISNQNVSPKVETSSFYVDRSNLYKSPRNSYTDLYKQILVDLHLIFHIDNKILSKYFRVDARYVKNWANMAKYHRRFGIHKIIYILGKIMMGLYLKFSQKGQR